MRCIEFENEGSSLKGNSSSTESKNCSEEWSQQDEVASDLLLVVMGYWLQRFKTEKQVQLYSVRAEMRSIVERVEDLIKSGYYEQISLIHGADGGLVCIYDGNNTEKEEEEEDGSEAQYCIERKDETESIAIDGQEGSVEVVMVAIDQASTDELHGSAIINAGSCQQQSNELQNNTVEEESSLPFNCDLSGKTSIDVGLHMAKCTSLPVLASHRRQNESSSSESKLEKQEVVEKPVGAELVKEYIENAPDDVGETFVGGSDLPVMRTYYCLDDCLPPDMNDEVEEKMLDPFGLNLNEPLKSNMNTEYGQQCESRWAVYNNSGISDSIIQKVASLPVAQIVCNGLKGLDADSDSDDDTGEGFPVSHPCLLCAKEFASHLDLNSHLLKKHDYHHCDEKEFTQDDTTTVHSSSFPAVEAKQVNNSEEALNIDKLAHWWVARIKKMEWVYTAGFYMNTKKKLQLYKRKRISAFCKDLIDRILSCDKNISLLKSEMYPNYNAFRYVSDHKTKEETAVVAINAKLINSLSSLSAVNFQGKSEFILQIIHRNKWNLEYLRKLVKLLVTRTQELSASDCLLNADLCQKIFIVGDMIPHDGATPPSWSSMTDLSEGKNNGDNGSDSSEVPITTKGKLFREFLIDQVALQFQFYSDGENVQHLSSCIGHVRFLEAIYSRDIDDGRLPDIIHEHCLKKLITSTDEDLLDCLCQLLLAVGCKLESYYRHLHHHQQQQQQQQQKQNNTTVQNDDGCIIPSYIIQLQRIAETHTSIRILDTISHLLLLQSHGWTTTSTGGEQDYVADASKNAPRKKVKRATKP